ncbi:3-keto-disaccharide hydrolase [Zavarzinella formosa]|uniref:3-keto-disaccharide hydrolase n=1 Tax=Zavarzinella formosa TaxID=360055 RepID=UPI000319E289|nr:DUF1080 domain-containing protein [Zavarzinella formosa]
MIRVLSVLTLLAFGFAVTAADTKPTAAFNGKDLAGWKTKEGESLDGKTEAYAGRFKVIDKELVLDPAVKGDKYIYTQAETTGDVTVSFEFKPGEKCNNDLFLRGTKFDLKEGGELKNWKKDDWNTFEIAVKGSKAEFKLNGETVKTMATKGDKSNFGLRAEFGAIKYRNIVMK